MNLRVRAFEEVSSTNNLIKAAIDAGEHEGLVIRALCQNAGYGRQGRGWRSPEGGLYCSWLFRPEVPPAHLPTLSLVVGLAVQKACEECVSIRGGDFGDRVVAVKWPNDVVVTTQGEPGFKKLCGISTEAYHGALCVGTGINVCMPDGEDEPNADADVLANANAATTAEGEGEVNAGIESNAKATTAVNVAVKGEANASPDTRSCSLSTAAREGGVPNEELVQANSTTERIPFYLSSFSRPNGDPLFQSLTKAQAIDQVFERLSSHIVAYYERWCRDGFAPFVQEFNAHNMLNGQLVELVDNSGTILHRGAVRGVNEDGTLQLRRSDGSEVAVSSGEVHVLFASEC